jgi:hypothetical protein
MSDISTTELRRALQKVELRAAEETNTNRAAAIREAGSIVESELLTVD